MKCKLFPCIVVEDNQYDEECPLQCSDWKDPESECPYYEREQEQDEYLEEFLWNDRKVD